MSGRVARVTTHTELNLLERWIDNLPLTRDMFPLYELIRKKRIYLLGRASKEENDYRDLSMH